MENETIKGLNESMNQLNNKIQMQTKNKFNSTNKTEKSLLEKINPLYENNPSDLEKLEKIFDNKKLVDLLNDPEINEESLQKELSRIDKDYEKDVQSINLLEEYSTHFLNRLESENKLQSKHLEKLLTEESLLNENKEIDDYCQDDEKDKETQMINLKQNKLIEKNILNLDLIINSVYRFQQIKEGEGNAKLSSEEEKAMLLDLNVLLLNDFKISKLENLDIFEKLEELYLQRNLIMKIENFTHLKNLQILSLNNNFIKKIENFSHLNNLKILDLSDNLINIFEIEYFPKNLVYLYLFDNLFYDELDIYHFRYLCLINFDNLIRLDSLTINEDEKMYLPNFNIKKIDSALNKNLKKKLIHISEHYKLMRKDRVKVLKEYMEYLDGSNMLSQSSINFTENNANNNENLSDINFISNRNLSIPGTPIANDNINNLSIQINESNANNSTINSSVKEKINDFDDNLSLEKLGKKVIREEKELINSEIKNSENTDMKLSEKAISEIKERSKQRKAEFESNFWITSQDIKEDLDDIKMKFKNFNHRFDRIKDDDMEIRIKGRMNFDQRINKVDEKLKDIDILSKNLGEKISEMKSQMDNPETFGFFNY